MWVTNGLVVIVGFLKFFDEKNAVAFAVHYATARPN
jgi:hypothetical protein